MFSVIFVGLLAARGALGQLCHQCPTMRFQQPQKRYNFNFEQFFRNLNQQQTAQFSSYNQPPRSPQRIMNAYGQDAEAFGSAIGKSIAQRIQQAYAHQDPAYDIQFTPPTTSSHIQPSPSTTSSTFSSSTSPQHYPTTSWPSTHPPEDLPTVQQEFAAAATSGPYGSASSSSSSVVSQGGFGGVPGMLPPPSSSSSNDFTNWTSGFRGKRKGDGKGEKTV